MQTSLERRPTSLTAGVAMRAERSHHLSLACPMNPACCFRAHLLLVQLEGLRLEVAVYSAAVMGQWMGVGKAWRCCARTRQR